MSAKVLIIGLDGASWDVLNPMMQRGYMPFLQKEIEQGRAGVLASTDPPITPTAWTSFQTGMLPEEHQILGFRRFYMEDGKLQSNILMSSNLGVPRIWDILSENERKLCILNLPLTYPPFNINGVLVSGFPIPSSNTEYTYPLEFKKELLDLIPDFQVMQSGIGADQQGMKVEEIVERWIRLMSQKATLALHLLRKDPWDVFMVHIQEGDLMQHRLWPCIDPRDSAHEPEDFKKVAAFYSTMDSRVASIVEEGRKQGYSVLMLSDHGFQRCHYNVKINNWLFENRYLVLKKDAKRMLISVLKKVADLPVFYKLRSRMKHRATTVNTTNQYLGSVIDYEKSVAFVETNATQVAFIHFFKRDPVLIQKILHEMQTLTNPSGELVVREIGKTPVREGVYKVTFADGHMATSIVPTHKPWIEVPVPFKQQVGMHHRDGVIILDGSLSHMPMPQAIHEVPALVMALQEIDFNPNGHGSAKASGAGESAADSFSGGAVEQEKSEIEKQLKDLGYL